MELAVLTHTAPRDWWDEPLEVISTAYDVLVNHAKKAEREGGKHRGR